MILVKVAVKVAPVSLLPKLKICNDFPPLPVTNWTWSEVNGSVVPSDLVNEYLSSSNGKNVSFSPAVGMVPPSIWLFAILTVNTFLIVIDAFVKSTVAILCFGKNVNSLSSLDVCISEDCTVKSVTFIALDGKTPLHIPATVSTPWMVTIFEPTDITFAKVGSFEFAKLVNLTRFPTSITFGNTKFVLVIVLIPAFTCVIEAIPIFAFSVGMTSALNVLTPTKPLSVAYTDFTSEIVWFVIAIAILPFASPLNINGSLGLNSPCLS